MAIHFSAIHSIHEHEPDDMEKRCSATSSLESQRAAGILPENLERFCDGAPATRWLRFLTPMRVLGWRWECARLIGTE